MAKRQASRAADEPTVVVEKERLNGSGENGVYTLSNGDQVRFKPVPDMYITRALQRIKNPVVPRFFDEDRGIELENPSDPAYLRAVAEADLARGTLTLDSLLMWGVELVASRLNESGWVKELQLMGEEFDPDDPTERRFVYLKHIAFASSKDSAVLMEQLDVTKEDLEQFANNFRGEKMGDQA